LKDILVMHKKV